MQATHSSLVLAQGMRPLSRTSLRGFASKAEKKVPQPSKESVQKRVGDLRKYTEQVREVRKDLIAKGYPAQGFERLRQKKMEEVKQNAPRKYAPGEKEERLKAGLAKHEAHITKFQEKHSKAERERILKGTMRRKKGDEFRATLLEAAQRDLAADIEQTWNRPIKEDLKPIVPVNAPFLGVLPKHHAEIAPLFGDEKHKIRQMYGPPKPLAPSENQYFGYDPRIFEFTVERKGFSGTSSDTWKPRKMRPTNVTFNAPAPPSSVPPAAASSSSSTPNTSS